MKEVQRHSSLYFKRLGLIFIVTVVVVWGISEAAFRLQKHNVDRSPEEIELVIPEGTAEQVAAGEAVPTIPDELVFVVGDVLVVRNEDVVTHELGPLLVPAASSARMAMEEADSFALSCSFQPTNYLGLDIKDPTTWETRLLAIAFAAPPTTVVVFLYSLVVRPVVFGEDSED